MCVCVCIFWGVGGWGGVGGGGWGACNKLRKVATWRNCVLFVGWGTLAKTTGTYSQLVVGWIFRL